MKSVILQLARNILETPFERFNGSTVDKARNRVIDVLGCLIAGANSSGCSVLRDLLLEWGGKKESTILVHGGKLPAHDAAMMNSVMARSYDYEPVGPFVDGRNTPGHISGTTVPTALAVAEQRGMSGKDLLAALILGDDLASRINAATGFSLDQGWDCVGTVNMFGATAIAGRLADLDERRMMHAFGIVLNQLGGTMQTFFDGVHAFKLLQGLSARAGIFSAALAAKGFTGVNDPLFSKYGYFKLFSRSCDAEILTKNLGREFYADNTFKPYPCCRVNHAAIDGALMLVQKENLKAEEVAEITVEIPPVEYGFAVGQPFLIREVPQIDASFSLQYCVAGAFLRGSVSVEHFSEQAVRDPAILDMIGRIRLAESKEPGKSLAARIRAKTTGGRTYEVEVSVPRGDDQFTPLTMEEKRQKFINNVGFSKTVSAGNAEKALSMLEKLEEVEKVSEITELLVA
ncbi:MAG: MmgE/PrpD family protein [Desulfobacteraceae bacterium]|nr:MAG: MmgE/PrpD family protein [Desulfobacteraceae bacterium]